MSTHLFTIQIIARLSKIRKKTSTIIKEGFSLIVFDAPTPIRIHMRLQLPLQMPPRTLYNFSDSQNIIGSAPCPSVLDRGHSALAASIRVGTVSYFRFNAESSETSNLALRLAPSRKHPGVCIPVERRRTFHSTSALPRGPTRAANRTHVLPLENIAQYFYSGHAAG
jgi:hypothetical protein